MRLARAQTSSSVTSGLKRMPPLVGQAVEAVLGAVGLDDADGAVVLAHGEAHAVDDVAHLDLVEEAAGVVAVDGGALELGVHVVEEVAGVGVAVHEGSL